MGRNVIAVFVFAALDCIGCGFTKATNPAIDSYNYPIDTTLTYYHAYGDSITFGYPLSSRETQAYPALIATQDHYLLRNYAISGDQACDIPSRQFIPNSDGPTFAYKGLYSLLIGTNDVNVKGAGSYEAVFNLCHQASLAWLSLPVESKVLATSTMVTLSGKTHLETKDRWNAQTTDAAGASITFSITLLSAGPVYIWYRITDDNDGRFSYALDSVVGGTVASTTVVPISTQNGTDSSLAFLRLPSVTAGAHSLTFTQTSVGNSGAGIVAVGTPADVSSASLPRVLAGTPPPQLVYSDGGNGVCSSDTTACLAYSADIAANVAMFRNDGLDVELFDTGKYMSASKTDMSDSLHPNATGHIEIYRAMEDVLSQQTQNAAR